MFRVWPPRVRSWLRRGIVTGVLAVGVLLLGADAQAQSQAKPFDQATSFTSGIQIQNLSSTSTANVTVSYFNRDGTLAATQSFSIAANRSFTLFGPSMSAPVGFHGSAVVSADQPIAAITNLVTAQPTTGEAYDGIPVTATTVNVPLFQQGNSGFNSQLFIQNTSAVANTVGVVFRSGATTITRTFNLVANGSIVVDNTNDGITGRFVGSATVTGTQPVAVTLNQGNGSILFSNTGSGMGSSTLFAPLLMTDNSRWSTGFQVQNASATQSTTVSLFLNGGTTAVATAVLAPGQSVTWFPIPGTSAGFVGSGTVTSTGGVPLQGTVNELNSTIGQGMAYSAFPSSQGTQTVSMPLIMFANNGFFTGEQIQNVGTCTTTVDFIINGTTVQSVTIPQGRSVTFFNTTSNLIPGGGRVASAIAHARESCGSLVGMVNEITVPQKPGDTSFAYEGFNQ